MKLLIQISFFAILWCIVPVNDLFTQKTARQVFARANEPDPSKTSVIIRWTYPDFTGKVELNIYRQLEGNGDWVKLNEQPWKKGVFQITEAELKAEPDLKMAVISSSALGDTSKEGSGFLMISVATKLITDHRFAQYLAAEYLDITATPGKSYKYQVREITGGSETTWGTSNLIKAGNFVRSPAIQFTNSMAADRYTKMNWTHDPVNIFGYNIYRGTGNEALKKINSTPILVNQVPDGKGGFKYPEWIFTDKPLVNNTVYFYELRGIDLFGIETLPSKEIYLKPVDLIPPALPEKFKMTSDSGIVTLYWMHPNRADLAGFKVLRQIPQRDTSWENITPQLLSADAWKFVDKVPDLNRIYMYKVIALDPSGNMAESEEQGDKVMDIFPPITPVNFTVTPDTGKIILKWKPNTETDLGGYRIYRGVWRESGVKFNLLNAIFYKGNEYIDTLPKQAKNKFVYKVTALDSVYNESEPTQSLEAVMPDCIAPEAPFLQNISSQEGILIITWIESLADDLMGYHIYRKKSDDPESVPFEKLNEAYLSPDQNTFRDVNPSSGQEYIYVMTATDRSGNESVYSNSYKGTTINPRVGVRPEFFKADWNKRKNSVALSWKIVPDPGIIGCMVFRKETDGKFRPTSQLLIEDKIEDSEIRPGKTYEYEIRAFNNEGNFSRSETVTIQIPQEK